LFKVKSGNFSLINTEPAAKLLSWQQHDECHFVPFVVFTSGAKLKEHCFNDSSSQELFAIECCAVLAEPIMM